ncbi:MAG: TonB-dependent receptor plug domain-containing protein, partial [Bacteroidota bacterium]
MNKTLLSLIAVLISISSLAHQVIKGKVTDLQSGIAIKGVNIVHPASGVGTVSDAFGNYVISSAVDIDTLVFSIVGYAQLSVHPDPTQEILNVSLTVKSFELNQVTIQSGTGGQQLNSISSIDLKLRPMNSSQDALRFVPGLFIGQHAGGGKAEQIFMRGFDIDHGTDINISVDGMPVNMVSHAHGQGYADLHFLIPETIDDIDWGKGPYQADKGNFATAGYVGFNTKTSLDKNMVKVEAGDFNTRRIVGMVNILPAPSASNKTSAYIASEFYGNNGPFVSPQLFTRLNLFGKLTTFLDNGSKLSVQASTFSSKWNASGQIP